MGDAHHNRWVGEKPTSSQRLWSCVVLECRSVVPSPCIHIVSILSNDRASSVSEESVTLQEIEVLSVHKTRLAIQRLRNFSLKSVRQHQGQYCHCNTIALHDQDPCLYLSIRVLVIYYL
jgi:hypothetical protein